jgi:nucleoside-diphosphate-sugar epimerase
MNVLVFGATSATGLQIATRALTAGHLVRAVVRDPKQLHLAHPRLEVRAGEVLDRRTYDRAFVGQDAVVSTIGAPFSPRALTLRSDATRNIVEGMRSNGVRRLIVVSSGATHPGRDPNQPFFFDRIVKPLFAGFYDDLRLMEEIVMRSGLDWTLLRAPRLVNKPGSGHFRSKPNAFTLPRGATLPREDLAAAALAQLAPSSVCQAIALAT